MGSLARPLSKNPAPASPSKTSILARELATEPGVLDFIIIRDPMQLPRGMVMAKHLNMKARPCTGPSISESSNNRWWMARRELIFHLHFCLYAPLGVMSSIDAACPRPPHPNDNQ
jgi:hypothetical protein